MEAKDKEPRSTVALVCGILGLLIPGLCVIPLVREPFNNFSLGCGILGVFSMGLCFVPLNHGRAGVVAKILGVVGLVGCMLLAFFFCYCLYWTARGMGWYGNQ